MLGQKILFNKISEKLLNQMFCGVMAVDKNCRVTIFNNKAQEITGINQNFILGRDIKEMAQIIMPHQEMSLIRAVKGEIKQGWEEEREIFYCGHIKNILLNIDLILADDGQSDGALATFIDITGYKNNEKEIIQREKLALLGSMAAGMAHEIRNPLTVIRGFAQILMGRIKEEDAKKLLELMLVEIDRTNVIITNFLLMSKPQLPILVKMNISKVMQQVIPLIESQCLMKGVNFIYSNNLTEIQHVNIDVNHLKQVIINLSNNAMEAMEKVEDKVIKLCLSKKVRPPFTVISIEDSGEGIDPKNLNKLGKPFFSTKENGTGLGLNMSYKLIENMDGKIEVISKKRKGTKFSILLPTIAV